MSLCRLIYKSIATAEIVSNETLLDLESRSSENNATSDITGLLVLTGNEFVQVLEGTAADVTQLFCQISADKRHQQVELILHEQIHSRLFEDWGMRLVDLYNLPGESRAYMAAKYPGQGGELPVPSDPHLALAFLLDAKHLCTSTPWSSADSAPANQETGQDSG